MGLISKVKNRVSQNKIDKGLFNIPLGSYMIMYHGVDLHENRKYSSRSFSVQSLKEHLIHFKKHFEIVSVKDYFETLNQPSEKPKMAITFDDGMANNFKYALPLFDEMKIPASFYVTGMARAGRKILWFDLYDIFRVEFGQDFEFDGNLWQIPEGKKHYENLNNTNFIEYFKNDKRSMLEKMDELEQLVKREIGDFKEREDLRDYWELMSDEQIKQVSKSDFIKLGAHGYYHECLGRIPLEKAKKELSDIKNYLEELAQYEIDELAYPDGSYTRETIATAAELGYKYQLAVNYHFEQDEDDKRIVDRIGLYPLPIAENVNRITHRIISH